MAKADDTSSTIDWIWLNDALMLAAKAFGSEVLAEKRLRAWMASRQLPWSCMSWEGPNADDIARLDRENRESIVFYIIPTVAYHEGDPQFWRADLRIWWEENTARERSRFGALAEGIKVSRKRLLALLREALSEHGNTSALLPAHAEMAAPGSKKSFSQPGPQMHRVRQVLEKLYAPDGKVPADVPTEVVRAQIEEALAPDNRNRGLASPSWDTVNRALGRD